MKKNFIRYIGNEATDKSKEKLEIYIKKSGGYIRYTFDHVLWKEIFADNWRIKKADFVSEDFSYVISLSVEGEWECAVKLLGRDDFSGGYMHGDEILDNVTFFVDGKECDITSLKEDKEFDTLCITEATRLYDPKDHETLIANHGKEYIFTGEKIVINQSLDWKVSEKLEAGYLAMFPVAKSVSNKFYTNKDFLPKEIYFDNFKGVSMAVSYGDNFFGRFSVTKYTKPLDECVYIMTDNGGRPYNKQYFIAGAKEDVYPDLRWESTTEYELDYRV